MIDSPRCRPLDAVPMRYVMPVIEEGADGIMPSAQSLRGYECAGRKRTFSKPDAMGDGIKIRSAQNPKRFPVILICSAKMTLKLSQEAVAVPFTIQNSCALSQDRRFQCSGLLLGGDDVAPLVGSRGDDGKT
jgi:hypothetical protein